MRDDGGTVGVQMRNAKVLCVGAGGIGCELLKTLVLTGFEDIAVVCLSHQSSFHCALQTGNLHIWTTWCTAGAD